MLECMEYFFYCRDRQGTGALRDRLTEDHWSFMDGYADAMIARGPTLTEDGAAATGSVHIVDLPDAEAARVFAYEEPNYRAGVYESVLVRRFRNTVGRTMWEFTGAVPGNRRFLILAQGSAGPTGISDALHADQRRHLEKHGYPERFIVFGALLSEDGETWSGTAAMVDVPDRPTAGAVLSDSPYAVAGLYDRVEVLPWRYGGRR
jgi:uncharacterized protein YciI